MIVHIERRSTARLAAASDLRQVNRQRWCEQDNDFMSKPSSLDLASLRQSLNERAQSLRQDLSRDRAKLAADVGDPHVVLDRKDQADLVTQAGVDDAELSRDLAELAQVEAAMQRLESGHFGRCQDCSQPIAPARLAAQPWASRCVACQTRFEKHTPRSAM
jgi:RNA polymerase-binding transcription factor DksA